MGERGSLTVEAVLVLPLLLMVALAAIEVFALATLRLDLVAAAREGARVAATAADPAGAVRAARESLPDHVADRVRVGVRRSAVVGDPAVVTVEISQPLSTPLLDRVSVPLKASATMRVER